MTIREYMKDNIVYLDGGLGTLLQAAGLKPGERPERWNITHKDEVVKIHCDYFDAGSNVVCANTFGANVLNFDEKELEEIIKNAIKNVRTAMKKSKSAQPKFVALDVSTIGRLLKPYGDFDFEDAISVFAKSVKLGEKYGADLIMIETMTDCYETKAAVIAAKENCDLPIFVSNAYGDDGKMMTGATPEVMISMLEGLGVDAIGVNCSLGPKALMPVVEKYLKCSSLPVLFKPNAGLPRVENGKTVFDVKAKSFATEVSRAVKKGVRLAGGCCGTTPEYICELVKKTNGILPKEIKQKNITWVSSYSHAVEFKNQPVLIGERINPTGKKRFKQALKENDIKYILNEGINQQEQGVHILDVNVGLPEIDEPTMLETCICELQTVTDLPLQIDTSDTTAMEKALRRYNGKAMVNSVNGKEESMRSVFPLVKKYGGVVVALTLDENGIPDTVQGRVEIAKKILAAAKEYGIDKKDIIFDTLAMTVSASDSAAMTTLGALKYIRNNLRCHTVLGVSNISFGLPNRDAVTSTFFALALENGLSGAIMNPYSYDMMKTYFAYRALRELDSSCLEYIDFASKIEVNSATVKVEKNNQNTYASDLQKAIIKGLKTEAAEITEKLLGEVDSLDIVNNEIIPALNIVGEGFEKKTVFLPQLLMSAESAGCAFEIIKSQMPGGENSDAKKCKFVIATVKGDIHDIGKNIVKLILENYGFDVIDLGKDVEPKTIADTIKKCGAPLLGLSALMTTTVPAMEETIKLVHKEIPDCKIVVGGAVLNKEYAEQIGADHYAADAMETVRYAEKITELV